MTSVETPALVEERSVRQSENEKPGRDNDNLHFLLACRLRVLAVKGLLTAGVTCAEFSERTADFTSDGIAPRLTELRDTREVY